MKHTSQCLTHLERLLKHAERIEELRLRVPAMVLTSKLSFPRLQTLDICALHPSDWASVMDDGGIPSLRTLQLTGCPLAWHSHNLSGLTTLFLCRVPAQSRLDIVEFLAALGRMQGLTVLHLECALASARGLLSSGAFEVSLKISLTRLARLFVIAPISTALVLLSHVNIPSKAKVRVEFQPEDGSSVDDYAKIPSILARRFGQPEYLSSSSPTIRSLVIRSPVYFEPTFAFSLSERGGFDPGLSMKCLPRDRNDCLVTLIGVEKSRMAGKMDRIICNICRSIPLVHVQTLHIIHPPHSLDFWRQTLAHLCGLRILKLSNGIMPNLVPLLALSAKEPAGIPSGTSNCASTPSHTYLPALEELVLCRMKLTFEDYAFEGSVPSDVPSERSLLEAFSTRKASCPRLTMIRCSPINDDFPELEDTEDEYEDEDEDGLYPFQSYVTGSSDSSSDASSDESD